MELKIKSRKLERTLTFSRPGNFYIFVDINGGAGSLGRQICRGGYNTGSTIGYDGDDEAEFARICRLWYRSFIREET